MKSTHFIECRTLFNAITYVCSKPMIFAIFKHTFEFGFVFVASI